MDPVAILNAAGALPVTILLCVVLAGLIYAGVTVVKWATQVTTLLGNHLRHDLSEQTEVIKRIERSTEEQTQVLKAMGVQLLTLVRILERNPNESR